MALYLTEEDVSSLLDMDTAIEAVEEAFHHQANGLATNSPRGRLRLTGGHFNLMTAAAPGLGVMGLKATRAGAFTSTCPAVIPVSCSLSSRRARSAVCGPARRAAWPRGCSHAKTPPLWR